METAKLEIVCEKTCDCSGNKISCITAKDWTKAQISVWRFSYEGRDIRDKRKHPAAFPLAFAAKAIQLLTHKGELVIDPFLGSGTTLVAAQDFERSAVGFDLNPKFIELAKSRMGPGNAWNPNLRQVAISDDSRNASEYLQENSAKLILTSPPYANMLNIKRKNKSRHSKERKNKENFFPTAGAQFDQVEQYSQDPRDLGTLDVLKYEQALTDIFSKLFKVLRHDGHCIVNVSDLYYEKKRLLIHVHVINALQAAGFEFRNTIIWDKTNIMNGVGIFGFPSNFLTMGAFEYILHFVKPVATE